MARLKRKRLQDHAALSIEDFRKLYTSNQHSEGHHFVIHQHDHPVAGVHYDLRLQISASSSVSWSIPYGMPCNPNSIRPNRMAIETRVHCLWNHLIESASHVTGSLLIWDTGTYEVLPRNVNTRKAAETDDELSDTSIKGRESSIPASHSDSLKLFSAFQSRHVRLRLHGSRLPRNYTVALRLPSANNTDSQPRKPKRRRKRQAPDAVAKVTEATSGSEDETISGGLDDLQAANEAEDERLAALASDGEDEDATIRLNNAYPGAHNTVNSIHQRRWFLALDRTSSGFVRKQGKWVRDTTRDGDLLGFEKFVVGGRDVERSVVTGRTAWEVMEDEGVEQYKGRKMWIPITE